MISANLINQIVDDVKKRIPDGFQDVGDDLGKNLRAALQATFTKFDIVTREEFDAQVRVLNRTREKLDALEAQLKKTDS